MLVFSKRKKPLRHITTCCFGHLDTVTEDGLATEKAVEDDIDAPVVFTSCDMVYMVLLLVLPGCLATNTTIGWGAIWLKIYLWNCEMWECDFFFPLMQGKPKIFQCTGSLFAWCCAVAWSTCFFIGEHQIFHNPTPLGTITGGVPCYVFNFAMIYICMVPKGKKGSLRHHFNIIRCWIPSVIWVCSLCVYDGLTFVQHEYVLKLHDEGKEWQYICGNIAIQMTFIGIREVLCNLPLGGFMGVENSDISFLWTLGYSAMYST